MKVLSGRSSNPATDDLLRLFTFTGALHWTGNRRLITGVGSNPKLVVTFPLLANRFHLLFWNCKCTEKKHIRVEN